jgi:predicted tellurium resistance membrane protein TerC
VGGTFTAHLRTQQQFSGRDPILIIGGLFLVYKAVTEIHEKLEGHREQKSAGGKAVTFSFVIVQILCWTWCSPSTR